jgi:hypothetical protein
MYLCTYYLIFLSSSHVARVVKSEIECGMPVTKGCQPLIYRTRTGLWHLSTSSYVGCQGLDEQKTARILAVHTGTKETKGRIQEHSAKQTTELLRMSMNQVTQVSVLLTGHCHLKGTYSNWDWQTAPSARDVIKNKNRLTCPVQL